MAKYDDEYDVPVRRSGARDNIQTNRTGQERPRRVPLEGREGQKSQNVRNNQEERSRQARRTTQVGESVAPPKTRSAAGSQGGQERVVRRTETASTSQEVRRDEGARPMQSQREKGVSREAQSQRRGEATGREQVQRRPEGTRSEQSQRRIEGAGNVQRRPEESRREQSQRRPEESRREQSQRRPEEARYEQSQRRSVESEDVRRQRNVEQPRPVQNRRNVRDEEQVADRRMSQKVRNASVVRGEQVAARNRRMQDLDAVQEDLGRRSAPKRNGQNVRNDYPDRGMQRARVQEQPGRRMRDADPEYGTPTKKRGKGIIRLLLLLIELIILVVAGVFLYSVTKTTKTGKVEIKEEEIIISENVQVAEETTMKGYRNVALFGVDSRDKELTKNTRSDSIIIASINQDTGECKLVSVYRDTYLNLGNDSYNKCNAAYAKGGPKQAINMLNMNMDMNITDFITIGFDGLTHVIDALGGVEINVLDAEISHLNNYQISMVGTTTDGEHFTAKEGVDYIPVTSSGMQTLNGLQATAYCRIRYVGDDFMRAERQRSVIQAILVKAHGASPTQLNTIAQNIFSEVYTSLDLSEILEILTEITKYKIVDTNGFPYEELRATGTIGAKGSCVIPVDLRGNVIWLHQFLFNDNDYQPSATVEEISGKVSSDTKGHY